jgi:hypothetical protein
LILAPDTASARILRLLASIDFVENPSKDTWSANATTYAMNSPPIAAGHRFVYDALVSSAIKAPEYLQKTSYRTPSQPTDTFFQYAKQTDLPFFEHLQTTPSLAADFNLFMGNTMGAREYWHEWYPVEKRLLVDFDENRSDTLLVDVGGGKGHDLQAFYTAFGKSKSWKKEGKLVLQELPHVLDAIPDGDLPPVVVKMTHDFFAEQPVKGKSTPTQFAFAFLQRHNADILLGARGYFLHHILHDWPDKYCHKILRALRQAMIPGYSKLLIHELILPDTGAAEIQARFDLVMMTLGGGAERSRAQWIGLLEDAGFCNIKLYEHLDHDGIIEAEASEKHVTVVN